MDKKILSILACPVCKGKVHYQIEQKEIWCKGDGLAFPVRDGIPVMLENEARDLNSDEKLSKV
ncbi:MAG: tetraacyldisaccharide 4'-kinase [Moraxellaceae bacterium]|nr:MAG: tetraacyldisaccharide 4'-kinase [Moraxellaceae bacterium]